MTMKAMTNRPMGVVVAVVNVAEIIIVLPGENVTIVKYPTKAGVIINKIKKFSPQNNFNGTYILPPQLCEDISDVDYWFPVIKASARWVYIRELRARSEI